MPCAFKSPSQSTGSRLQAQALIATFSCSTRRGTIGVLLDLLLQHSFQVSGLSGAEVYPGNQCSAARPIPFSDPVILLVHPLTKTLQAGAGGCTLFGTG